MIFEHVFGRSPKKHTENADGKEAIFQHLLGALRKTYSDNDSFTREDAERVYARSHDIALTDLKEHHKIIVGHALSTLAHSSHSDLFFNGEVYWLTPPRSEIQH